MTSPTASMMTTAKILVACLLGIAGCTDDGPATFGDALDDPQLPPRGLDDIEAWIAAGHYQAWHCEMVAQPSRGSSPHGTARVCNNDALHAAAPGGRFPVGSAAVKELYDDGVIVNHSVSRRLTDDAGGDAWYWYEQHSANGAGEGKCTGCHATAPHDYVFIVVQ